VLAANVVYLSNGSTMKAKSITWSESKQEYRIEDAQGTIIPVPRKQVERLEIDKPAEYDKAAQLVESKQYDAAIPVLDDLVTRYRMLVWDNQARELLAKAYLGKNDPKKAASAIDAIFETTPKEQATPEVRQLYWNALLMTQRNTVLRTDLDEAVAKGPRELAAVAMLVRGDLDKAEGKKEDALLNYLRVVILYEQFKAVQPEALFKAAQVLEELRDPRANAMRQRLASDYPDSKYARQASGK
jgi:TolA-binding protein